MRRLRCADNPNPNPNLNPNPNPNPKVAEREGDFVFKSFQRDLTPATILEVAERSFRDQAGNSNSNSADEPGNSELLLRGVALEEAYRKVAKVCARGGAAEVEIDKDVLQMHSLRCLATLILNPHPSLTPTPTLTWTRERADNNADPQPLLEVLCQGIVCT